MQGRRLAVLLLLIGVVLLAACGGGDDGDDQDPIVTIESTATEVGIAEDSTAAPTEGEQESTTSPTESELASPTESEASPTESDTGSTATAVTVNTPTPALPEGVDPRAAEEMLALLPTEDALPEEMEQTEEVVAGIEEVLADAEDPEARRAELEEWGFAGAVRRTFQIEPGSTTPPVDQLMLVSTLGMRLATPEFADAQLAHDRDDYLNDPELTLEEVPIDPIGDNSAAALGQSELQGTPVQIGSVWVRKGTDTFRFGAVAGTNVDVIGQLTALAQASFGGGPAAEGEAPAVGELLYATNFEDWEQGTFDAGSLTHNGSVYRLTVNPPPGTYVSAFTTGGELFGDLSVTVQMRQIAGPAEAEGCVMLRVDPENQNHDYAFCVSSTGYTNAVYETFDENGAYDFETIFEGDVTGMVDLSQWTTLQMIAQGNQFWFFVNGELVGSAQHDGPTEGEVGIVVNNFADQPVEFEYQNLEVHGLQ